ncbi:MAG: site-specific DNA-methyltransferase [Kiritimatiellia bacterium]|nr:site-specific DNA-methyltransferase [Kiritimatiellia bacterium]
MNQQELDIKTEGKTPTNVSDFRFAPIKGQPMLQWRGKRPFTSTSYFPAQEKEQHGEEVDGWLNKIFWGDNIQVMSHLLKEYRGKVDLIYIDPPFDSKADYKKKVDLRGRKLEGNSSAFEDKQYTDIWSNDEYLQFIFERLILMRELLTESGCIYLHCDWHKVHLLRSIFDEIFGMDHFVNEIIWQKTTAPKAQTLQFSNTHDTILVYAKGVDFKFNKQYTPYDQTYIDSFYKYIDEQGRRYRISDFSQGGQGDGRWFGKQFIKPNPGKHWIWGQERIDEGMKIGRIVISKNGVPGLKRYLDEMPGNPMRDIWTDINSVGPQAVEVENYPTQKPEALLERIIKASSNPGDLVFDCFMGSGTTQAVAMKLGRRFIGADINLGAIQTTTKRLINVAAELNKELPDPEHPKYTGFSVYNVNNYDVFRNPVEAKDILVQALELEPLPGNTVYDGMDDDWYVKIMPVNRIATREDLNEIEANFPIKEAEKFKEEHPNKVFQKIRLVCMGHEPALDAELKKMIPYNIEVEILDILRDKSDLRFKRDAEAKIKRTKTKLTIEKFYPMNLMEKLSMQKEKVTDWREMVESVMIDFNYDGSVFTPTVTDIPEKDEFVKGEYDIPEDAGTIRVKITDLLSESLEQEVS